MSGRLPAVSMYATTALLALILAAGPAGVQAPPALPILRGGNVVVHYWPEQRKLAASLLVPATLDMRLPGLPDTLLRRPPAIDVFIAPDESRFESLTGGRAPGWGAGVAFPDRGTIVLPGYASERGGTGDLRIVLRHELAHVALHRYLDPNAVPHWFSEGYATWAAGQLDPGAGWILRLAFLTGRAPPLDSITLGWPAGETDARVAYLLSASAVEYLYAHGGDRALTLFLRRWRDGAGMEGALIRTYGLDLAQLEKYWSQDVRRRYGWILFLGQSAVLWLIVGVFVVLFYIIRRRRDRARLRRLRETELPDAPAFWLPDSEPASGEGEALSEDQHEDTRTPPRRPAPDNGGSVDGPPDGPPSSEA